MSMSVGLMVIDSMVIIVVNVIDNIATASINTTV